MPAHDGGKEVCGESSEFVVSVEDTVLIRYGKWYGRRNIQLREIDLVASQCLSGGGELDFWPDDFGW